MSRLGVEGRQETDLHIREFEERDLTGIRSCIVILQDDERQLDPRMPSGSEIVDEYLPLILERAEAYAREAQVQWLRIGVLSSNVSARTLYSSAGFRPYLEYFEKQLTGDGGIAV